MELTDKIGHDWKNAVLAVLMSGAFANPVYPQDSPFNKPYVVEIPSISDKKEETYTLADFIKAYGEQKWQAFSEEEKQKSKEIWEKSNKDYRARVTRAYSNPHEEYQKSTKEQKKNSRDFLNLTGGWMI